MKKRILSLILALVICTALAVPALADGLTANPTSASVFVDGETVAFDAYHIEGNNYFKLRDLAYVLNGTLSQFSVEYDAETRAISLRSGKAYTPDGSEMKSKGEGTKSATPTTSEIFIDGVSVNLTAYHIDGNNYFKLRDIGMAFDFFIGWDGVNIHIESDYYYDYENEGVNVQPPENVTGVVGETYSTMWFDFKVNSMKASSGIGFWKANPGFKFVTVNITITNTMDYELFMTSLFFALLGENIDEENTWPILPSSFEDKDLEDTLFPIACLMEVDGSITADIVYVVPVSARDVGFTFVEISDTGRVYTTYTIEHTL